LVLLTSIYLAMSSEETFWFCHECNAEMRPLMMPDPHCASCHGTFVEKLENSDDDPREYQQHMPGGLDDGYPPGMDNFLLGLHNILGNSGGRDRRSPTSSSNLPSETLDTGGLGRGTRIEFTSGRNGGTQVVTLGGTHTLGRSNNGTTGEVPTLSQFLRRGSEPSTQEAVDRTSITGPLMIQYLMALLSLQRQGGTGAGGGMRGDPFPEVLGRLGADGAHGGSGRWGDYVFNQEALDHIITQLMENSNSSRPVPATDEIITNLPREVLEDGSPRLQMDCAVCKDQFKLGTDDPDEQIVVTLPCKHPFHEGCIVPWIKSSGTCPVCRYALVPQPEQHGSGQEPPSGASNPSTDSPSGPTSRSSGGRNTDGSSGFFNSLFGSMGGGHSGGGSGGSRTGSRAHASTYDRPRRRRRDGTNGQSHPGGWSEQVD